MAKQGFLKFFQPSAGAIAGFLLVFLFGVVAAILLVREGGTPTSLGYTLAAIVMITVTIGTGKRMPAAAAVGLVIAVAYIIWAVTLGQVISIVLAIPTMGGFWTAMRGIEALRRLREEDPIAATDKWDGCRWGGHSIG